MATRTLRPLLASLLSIAGSAAIVACEGAMGGSDAGVRRDGAITVDAREGDHDGALVDAAPSPDGSIPAEDGGPGPTPDAGPAGVPIFVAQGYVGRTTISCDDGRTWIANRSTDDSVRCFGPGGPDCDHHPGRAKGIVYSGRHFVATFGWGPAGGVDRSRDGRTWERTLDGTTFGGIAVGDGTILLGARSARTSDDDGATWSDPIETMLEGWNVRRAGFARGRHVLVGDGGDVTLSSDGGATWWRPTTIPGSCGAAIQNEGGIAEIGDAIVIVGGDGGVCRSTDGGVTFTAHASGASGASGDVISTGTQLMFWDGDRAYTSSDGASWASTPLSPSTVRIGAVERSPGGTFVAVNGGWDQWYDRQRWYRSTDGITWEVLDASAAVRSHPILSIAHGTADPAACAP